MRNGRLGHVEITIEVGLDGAVEVLVRQVFDLVDVLLECRVVDEDVDLIPLFD